MKIEYSSNSLRQRHYVPLALGNGSLSLMVDQEGVAKQQTYCSMTPTIVRAGKRYENKEAALLKYGYFDQEIKDAGKLTYFKQTLDLDNALCECISKYESNLEVTTKIFCHSQKDIICITKEFSYPVDYTFCYHTFDGPFLQLENNLVANGKITYSTGNNLGFIQISSTNLSLDNSSNKNCAYYRNASCSKAEILLAFDEEITQEDTIEKLFQSHIIPWQKYWSECKVDIKDEAIYKMYMVAQYHLKISSTKWSCPTGIFPTHWQARFFAYDELYTHGAFLTSGHFEEALKIDNFRYSILPKVIRRACYVNICQEDNLAAHFPWETLEDGSEGAPEGFWMDRYIHMVHVAFNAYECYSFTKDDKLLKEKLYPLIKACVQYINRCGVYYDSVTGPYIGKCTDMERFGEFIERPYSTTCGAIAVFKAAVKCAKILNVDESLSCQWDKLADKLYQSLPVQEDRYVPYLDCPQRSIAMYHGIFPFNVIDVDNPLQIKALEDTENHFEEFAGQYFNGSTLSSWYAGVIATAETRRGNIEKAIKLIKEAANNSTGCFYECFEVYEREKLPWFTTASGALIRAINELLKFAQEHNINLDNYLQNSNSSNEEKRSN